MVIIRYIIIKYVLLDNIRASYSVFTKLVGSRGDLGCLMVQILVMMFLTVLFSYLTPVY